MAEFELVIFDDAVARDWYPFALTRPVGELMLGTLTLRARAERVLDADCVGYLCADHLAGFDEHDAPRVLTNTRGNEETKKRVYLSSRCVLLWDVVVDTSVESTLRVGEQVVGWVVPAGAATPTDDDILAPSAMRGTEQDIGGGLIENVWDLVRHNLDHIASDILHFHPSSELSHRPANAYLIGDYPLIVGEHVTIEPGVVFDLTAGPVWLADGVKVRALSRIAGPMYVGEDSTLLGGSYTACTIGPLCKIHGEIEETIVIGYSNKAHDGFLGHSIVGKWVNLGALTTNSDLKNNYSTVRVHTPGGTVDTGLMKLGALIGDHVKTAIGTMINTGTVVGPGANIFGGMPPKHVPPFSWGDGKYELEKFLETAERAMHRREIDLSTTQREMLSRVWRSSNSGSE